MRLNDKAWALGRSHGVIVGTVSGFTRGDSTCDEFFTTEAEAWAAEAVRCGKEAERSEMEAARFRKREAEALAKSRLAPAEARP